MDSIGLKIKKLMNKEKIDAPTLARRLGKTKQAVYDMLGKDDINTALLRHVAAELGVSVTYFFDEDIVNKPVQQSNGLPLIPIDAVAGFPTADNDGAALADCQRYVVPEFNTKGANFLIRVSGDSMMPMFHNGDIIACRKISDVLFFQWGEVYVLDTSQGVLVKRVRECQADEACITCESENERYGSFRLPKSDIRSLSTIVGLIRIM